MLHALQEKHPEYEISVLVRDSSKGEKITRAHPNVRIVLGELDSTSSIEEEARKADIVVSEWFTSTVRLYSRGGHC